MNEPREQPVNDSARCTTGAPTTQKSRRQYQKHGHFKRVKALRYRGVKAINGRTRAGREAKRWGAWAMGQKGNGSAPLHTRQEIELATLDLWLLLELGSAIVEDARKRGAVLNQRRKELPRVHEQYNQVSISGVRLHYSDFIVSASHTYDALNWLPWRLDPLSGTTGFTYDAKGACLASPTRGATRPHKRTSTWTGWRRASIC